VEVTELKGFIATWTPYTTAWKSFLTQELRNKLLLPSTHTFEKPLNKEATEVGVSFQ
jgi:hypothetical protein